MRKANNVFVLLTKPLKAPNEDHDRTKLCRKEEEGMGRGALGEEEPARGAQSHTFIYHLKHYMEKAMAARSSVLAWKTPWREKPDGLQSMGSQSRTQLKRLSIPVSPVVKNSPANARNTGDQSQEDPLENMIYPTLLHLTTVKHFFKIEVSCIGRHILYH